MKQRIVTADLTQFVIMHINFTYYAFVLCVCFYIEPDLVFSSEADFCVGVDTCAFDQTEQY